MLHLYCVCFCVCDVASGSDKPGLSCKFIGFLVFNQFFPQRKCDSGSRFEERGIADTCCIVNRCLKTLLRPVPKHQIHLVKEDLPPHKFMYGNEGVLLGPYNIRMRAALSGRGFLKSQLVSGKSGIYLNFFDHLNLQNTRPTPICFFLKTCPSVPL